MSNIYTPPNCQTLDKIITLPQIRLGLQGFSGTGKTWSSMTFPNPIVINLDRGLGAHTGRPDIIEIPFYLPSFGGTAPGMLKDKLIEWLSKEGKKLTSEQTLVFDGCTSLQNAYHKWFDINQNLFLTKQGKVDDFAVWREKKNYYAEVMEIFKSLTCNVIFISHEADKKDKDGSYSGKIRPLLTGQFQDELVSHFTDWFRQHSCNKPVNLDEVKDETLKNWGMNKQEFKDMCNSFPRNTVYYWQCEGDDIFDGKTSSLVGFPRYIPANYESFCKYRIQLTIK